MTRTDYALIATTLRAAKRECYSDEYMYYVLALAAAFERDNARFKRELFLTACGL